MKTERKTDASLLFDRLENRKQNFFPFYWTKKKKEKFSRNDLFFLTFRSFNSSRLDNREPFVEISQPNSFASPFETFSANRRFSSTKIEPKPPNCSTKNLSIIYDRSTNLASLENSDRRATRAAVRSLVLELNKSFRLMIEDSSSNSSNSTTNDAIDLLRFSPIPLRFDGCSKFEKLLVRVDFVLLSVLKTKIIAKLTSLFSNDADNDFSHWQTKFIFGFEI